MAPLVPLYTKTQELRHHISLEPCRIGSDLDIVAQKKNFPIN